MAGGSTLVISNMRCFGVLGAQILCVCGAGLLREELLVSAEDEEDYEAPEEGSVLYKLYSLVDVLLMVRSTVSIAHPRHDQHTFRVSGEIPSKKKNLICVYILKQGNSPNPVYKKESKARLQSFVMTLLVRPDLKKAVYDSWQD